VPRDLDEEARDVARSLANTPACERSRHRWEKVEMLFAHLKRILSEPLMLPSQLSDCAMSVRR
jgi:hypothetical protein